jgi:hypothetical protein
MGRQTLSRYVNIGDARQIAGITLSFTLLFNIIPKENSPSSGP